MHRNGFPCAVCVFGAVRADSVAFYQRQRCRSWARSARPSSLGGAAEGSGPATPPCRRCFAYPRWGPWQLSTSQTVRRGWFPSQRQGCRGFAARKQRLRCPESGNAAITGSFHWAFLAAELAPWLESTLQSAHSVPRTLCAPSPGEECSANRNKHGLQNATRQQVWLWNCWGWRKQTPQRCPASGLLWTSLLSIYTQETAQNPRDALGSDFSSAAHPPTRYDGFVLEIFSFQWFLKQHIPGAEIQMLQMILASACPSVKIAKHFLGRAPTSSWTWLRLWISWVLSWVNFSSSSDLCLISFLILSRNDSLLFFSTVSWNSSSVISLLRLWISFSLSSSFSASLIWASCSFFSRISVSTLKLLVALDIKPGICMRWDKNGISLHSVDTSRYIESDKCWLREIKHKYKRTCPQRQKETLWIYIIPWKDIREM